MPMMIAMVIVMATSVGDGAWMPKRNLSKNRGKSRHPVIAMAAQRAVYKSDCLKIWNCCWVMWPDEVTFGNMAITMVLDKKTVILPRVAA